MYSQRNLHKTACFRFLFFSLSLSTFFHVNLSNVESLHLFNFPGLGDNEFHCLQNLPNLKSITFEETSLNDSGLADLVKCAPNLQYLKISASPLVSGKGMRNLVQLKKLTALLVSKKVREIFNGKSMIFQEQFQKMRCVSNVLPLRKSLNIP